MKPTRMSYLNLDRVPDGPAQASVIALTGSRENLLPGAGASLSGASARALGAGRHVLIFRFLFINLFAAALLIAAYLCGFVNPVIDADRTGITLGIAAVFAIGLVLAAWKVWSVSAGLDEVVRFMPGDLSRTDRYIEELKVADSTTRSLLADNLRLMLGQNISVIKHFANSLVLLGLIGTVVGFIIALSGVDAARSTDVSAITPMMNNLISGMSTALYTTLVGAVLNIWLMINYQMLASGTVALVTSIVELGERHARH